MGAGEIIVRREGYSRARHEFISGGRTIARLKWRGMRRATYEADGIRFDINVGALDRRIALVAEDGSESFLVERSRANPHREVMRVEYWVDGALAGDAFARPFSLEWAVGPGAHEVVAVMVDNLGRRTSSAPATVSSVLP